MNEEGRGLLLPGRLFPSRGPEKGIKKPETRLYLQSIYLEKHVKSGIGYRHSQPQKMRAKLHSS